MRRARVLLGILALALSSAAPAGATSVTVQITGAWTSVTDTANVFGGTVIVGTTYVATLVYDDETTDGDPINPNLGDYDVPAATSDLSFTTATFAFNPGSASLLGISIDDDNAFGEDGVFLFINAYTATGLPLGITLGGTRYVNATLTDTSAMAHSSDALTGLPWSTSSYNLRGFDFYADVVGADPGDYIDLKGSIITLLPEPSVLGLGLMALLGLTGRRLRG